MTSYTRTFGDDSISASRLGFYALALTTDTTLTWPQAQSDAVPMADQLDVTPSTGGLSLTLPDARQASPGASTLISNLGASTFTVKDSAGGVVTTIAAGAVKHIYLRTNTTAAGTWGVVLFGAASSALTAADVDGPGLRAVGTELVQTMPVSAVVASHTITASDRARLFRNTGGAITVSLTAAASIGSDFFFAYRNDGTGDITINPDGTELIDGAATLTLSAGDACFIVCDGAAWYSVGLGQTATFVWDSISISNEGSDLTLNATQYGKAYLQFIAGMAPADIDVTFPAFFKIYFIDNVSGGTLTLKATGGVAEVTVEDGTQYIVLCDGETPPNIKLAHTVTATTVSTFPAGTAAAPSLSFNGDADTGFYAPGADQAGVSTGGSARMTWGTTNISQSPLEVPAGASGNQAPRASEVQPLDALLTAIAALNTAADRMIYATGSDTVSLATLTAAARALLDDADATAMRATLGLGTVATENTVPAGKGGTGQATLALAVQDLLDTLSTTRGTLLYRGASDWVVLAPGTAGHLLSTNGVGADPSWTAPAPGAGQTWNDETTTRALSGAVYQNTDDVPIIIMPVTTGSAGTTRFTFGPSNPPTEFEFDSSSAGSGVAVAETITIPAAWYYKAVVVSGSRSVSKWFEYK